MLIQDGRHFAKRSTEPIPLPSDEGISGVVDATDGPTASVSLAVDPTATAPAGSVAAGPVFTVVQTTLPTHAAAAVSSGKSIPVSAVIGSCIGAFIFVSALIIFGVWFYRRYSQSLRRQALSRGSLKLRLKPAQRRRPWSKLEDDEGKWASTNHTKEVDQVVPMEKLTMFKRAASVRTAYTQKSVDDHTLTYPQSFAPFDANLVRTLSADPTIDPQPQSQSSQAISIKPPKLSPSTTNFEPFAIPTPPATVHKWESAVVQYDGQYAAVVEDKEVKSLHNPFFGSQEYNRLEPNAKGKDTHESISSSLLSSDPFEAFAKLPKPSVLQTTDSSTYTQSKTRALQTLMGALELSEDEVRDRLRVASMQLSVVSQYATPMDEEFVDNIP